jgi:hypothetical protein
MNVVMMGRRWKIPLTVLILLKRLSKELALGEPASYQAGLTGTDTLHKTVGGWGAYFSASPEIIGNREVGGNVDILSL